MNAADKDRPNQNPDQRRPPNQTQLRQESALQSDPQPQSPKNAAEQWRGIAGNIVQVVVHGDCWRRVLLSNWNKRASSRPYVKYAMVRITAEQTTIANICMVVSGTLRWTLQWILRWQALLNGRLGPLAKTKLLRSTSRCCDVQAHRAEKLTAQSRFMGTLARHRSSLGRYCSRARLKWGFPIRILF